MDASTLLRAGRLDDALRAIQAEVRQNPQLLAPRLLLFGLDCVLGRWEKALSHLDAISSLDKEWVMPAFQHRGLIQCELQRAEVFKGKERPIILGEPAEWVSWFVEALSMEAAGQKQEAWDLRAKAWEESPAYASQVNGTSGEWLADPDARLGPILEAYIEARYYWVPFGQIKKIEIRSPEAVSDLVWISAKISLITGSDVQAYLPVRYPGTEGAENPELRLSRSTEWESVPGGVVGLGQKMLQSEESETPLLECRTIEFAHQAIEEPAHG